MINGKNVLWLSDANTAHTRRWVKALAERGLNILVFSLAEPERDWALDMPNVRLETAGFSSNFSYGVEGALRKVLYGRSLISIMRLVRDFKPFLVHAHYASSYGVLATVAGLRPRIVSAWGADVYTAPEKSALHNRVICKVLRSADSVLSTSWTMRDRVLELVEREVVVVPFGIDVDRFRPASVPEDSNRPFVVGSVKTLDEKYGMEYLLRGYSILKQRFPETPMRLKIVGGGPLRDYLVDLSNQLDVDADFVGRVDYDSVHAYHQELDVAVYPSVEDSESFGVSVIESQACEVPVVVSRVGGLAEVVNENVTGLVVPSRDATAIADALQRLLADSAYRKQLGIAGRQRVITHYSLQHTVDLMLSEYEKYQVA